MGAGAIGSLLSGLYALSRLYSRGRNGTIPAIPFIPTGRTPDSYVRGLLAPKYVKRGQGSRLAGKMKKKGKKVKRKGPQWKGAHLGAVCVTEKGGVLTDKRCIFIGHTDIPMHQVALQVCKAIIRKLMWEGFHYEIQRFLDATTQATAGNLTFTFEYYADPAVMTSTINTFYIGSGTYDLIASSLYTQLVSVLNNNVAEFYTFTVSDSAGVQKARIMFNDITVHMSGKSTLKIQNRSVSATGAETTDVDNTPLYGKSYYAKGTGLVLKDLKRGLTYQPLSCDKLTGVCQLESQKADPTVMAEPPQAWQFTNVSRLGKIRLNAGDIKTDTLSLNKRMSLPSFLKQFTLSIGSSAPYLAIGQSRTFALEKVMEIAPFATALNLSVAYERNYYLSTYITYTNKRTTLQEFVDFN